MLDRWSREHLVQSELGIGITGHTSVYKTGIGCRDTSICSLLRFLSTNREFGLLDGVVGLFRVTTMRRAAFNLCMRR